MFSSLPLTSKQLSYTGMILIYDTFIPYIQRDPKMPHFIDPLEDFVYNLNPLGERLTMVEQSALNLLVELTTGEDDDNILFSIAIILQLTVEQAVSVKYAYNRLLNEDYENA